MKLPTLRCKRCGWTWHPRKDKLPKTCPEKHCKSLYWRTEVRQITKPKKLPMHS